MQQLPLGVRLRDSSVFASYFPGVNAEASARLQQLTAFRPTAPASPLSDAPGVPIWLWGPSSSGKTHLLQAVCAAASVRGQTSAYLPAGQMLDWGPAVIEGWGQFEWVCIDDVQTLLGQPAWERALFGLLLELQDTGGRLLLAAETPPSSRPTGLPDLGSRLNAGLLIQLHRLPDEEQLPAIQLRAAQRGLELPNDTGQYLWKRLRRDMASLCAFLDRLDEASLVAQRRLTIPFVRQVLLQPSFGLSGAGRADTGYSDEGDEGREQGE